MLFKLSMKKDLILFIELFNFYHINSHLVVLLSLMYVPHTICTSILEWQHLGGFIPCPVRQIYWLLGWMPGQCYNVDPEHTAHRPEPISGPQGLGSTVMNYGFRYFLPSCSKFLMSDAKHLIWHLGAFTLRTHSTFQTLYLMTLFYLNWVSNALVSQRASITRVEIGMEDNSSSLKISDCLKPSCLSFIS